jgi:RimJ/RimL family protein N-acetyltransferase
MMKAMTAPELSTENVELKLIAPNVERDTPLSVAWLAGSTGRETLKLMGVPDTENKASTLEQERARVEGFLARQDQLNWMLEFSGDVVGSIWVDLEPSEHVPAPAVHLMIGEPNVRGQGLGGAALRAVLRYLQTSGTEVVYSRHLTNNKASAYLLAAADFAPQGQAYRDGAGLVWQNVAHRYM